MACLTFSPADVRRFSRLTSSERHLFVKAVLLLRVVAVALPRLGFGRLQRLIIRLTRSGQPREVEQARVKEIVWAVSAAARRAGFRTNCLERSLLLWWVLLGHGLPAQLRIGVRKRDGRLQAHAWVELHACVLADTVDVGVEFTPFDRAIVPAVSTR